MERSYEAVSRFILLCAVITSGCATAARVSDAPFPASADPGPTAPLNETSNEDELLRYIESVRVMPGPLLEREATAVDASVRAKPNTANRLRLGVFLAFAPPPYRATGRAQELLDRVWQEDTGDQRDIVRLLLAVLHDRQELEAALNDERRQRQALRNKLDQLKAIEEDLDRRMQPAVINPR